MKITLIYWMNTESWDFGGLIQRVEEDTIMYNPNTGIIIQYEGNDFINSFNLLGHVISLEVSI